MYGKQGMKFVDFYPGWEEKFDGGKDLNILVLDYDYEKEPGMDYDPKKGRIIDRTDLFKRGEAFQYIKN
jgi:hypothetical protein